MKTASRWQQVTINEWVTDSFIEPIHSNDWFIQKQSIRLWITESFIQPSRFI